MEQNSGGQSLLLTQLQLGSSEQVPFSAAVTWGHQAAGSLALECTLAPMALQRAFRALALVQGSIIGFVLIVRLLGFSGYQLSWISIPQTATVGLYNLGSYAVSVCLEKHGYNWSTPHMS